MTERKRRSEQMLADELKAFKKQYNSFPTKTDAEIFFGVSRQVLDNVFLKGSGAPETIAAIREKIAA